MIIAEFYVISYMSLFWLDIIILDMIRLYEHDLKELPKTRYNMKNNINITRIHEYVKIVWIKKIRFKINIIP